MRQMSYYRSCLKQAFARSTYRLQKLIERFACTKSFFTEAVKKRHRQTIITQVEADEKQKPAHGQTIILPFVKNGVTAQITMCEGRKPIEKNGGHAQLYIKR
jgi:hypothetical protein